MLEDFTGKTTDHILFMRLTHNHMSPTVDSLTPIHEFLLDAFGPMTALEMTIYEQSKVDIGRRVCK
jgi:hypothetical protein